MPLSPNKGAVVIDTSRSPHARLHSVPVNAVTLTDAFWAPRLETNRTVTLPSQHRHLEDTGCLDNFRRAAGRKDAAYRGPVFADSDAYKWLEAACWTLAARPDDPALKPLVEDFAAELAAAQQPDGYINTYYSLGRAGERCKTLDTGFNNQHELYCAGHFFQAAVAHFRATGKANLLHVATRFADLICDTFGPAEAQQHGTDGHPEVEMSLVELYRITGNRRYLDTAQYFVDVRLGMGRINDAWQEMKPFRELTRINGHAVCAAYLTAGVTDIVSETGEAALRETLDRLWNSMTERQMYVTGGIGSRWDNEAFGYDYELPVRAYAETCASIASVFWNHRMLHLTGDAKYADVLERALYNGVLSGWSLDGKEYFYQNPLADDGAHRRQEWFGCACCPPNLARLLASLPGYVYSVSETGIHAHLYAASVASLTLPDGRRVKLIQDTRCPWDGNITFTVEGEGEWSLFLRVPAWAGEGASLRVEGSGTSVSIAAPVPGQHAELRRYWKPGDTVHLALPMPVRRVVSHPRVSDTRGSVALMRGPLVYCLEHADNPGTDIRAVALPPSAAFVPEWQPGLLGGVAILRGSGEAAEWPDTLYSSGDAAPPPTGQTVPVTAIPYYAWANREPGPMRVWLPIA